MDNLPVKYTWVFFKDLSFHTIIANIKPSVIILNETHYRNDRKMSIPGYDTYNRNRQNKCMGGIATAICNKESMHALKVKEGEKDDEFLDMVSLQHQ